MKDTIHWFPGHMKKALNELNDLIKLVDVVIELVDARSPNKTHNPYFDNVIKNKLYIKVLSKSDLADLNKIKLIDNEILFSNNNKKSITDLVKKIDLISKPIKDKYIKKGVKNHLIKAIIIGVPNVGKSSLINALNKKNILLAMNKPGLTRSYRWINVFDKFYLLDSPGILPSNYLESNFILGLLGTIKIDLLPTYDLSEYGYKFIFNNYKDLLIKKYGFALEDSQEFFKKLTDKRGFKNDKSITYDMARNLFLKDIRDGNIGPIYIDE